LEREVFVEVLFEVGFWGQEVGEVGASEVGSVESPTPLDVASPLDFKA